MTTPSPVTSDNSHDQLCPIYFPSFPLNSVQGNFVYIFLSKYVGRTIYEWNWELRVLAYDQGLNSTVFKSQQRKQTSLFPERPRPALGPTEPLIELVPLIFLSRKVAGMWQWPLTFIPINLHMAPRLQMVELYLCCPCIPSWNRQGKPYLYPSPTYRMVS